MFKKLNWFKKSKKHPLKTQGLRFTYNKHEILKNINLTVKTNQIIAVVGRSGEGKSTFLNLIVGVLTKKYEGSIKILGHERGLAKEDIGYVPQDISLIPELTIRENILFFGNMNGVKDAISKGKTLMKTLKLDLSLERLPTELSGGQKVRLNILLSFLHNPKVLILDEPFVGLDYLNRKILWQFLKHQKNKRKTIILTTHMLAEAELYTNKIIILHAGKIVAKGKLDEICEKFKTRYISEIKLRNLSKTKEEQLKQYCKERNITIMNNFNEYFMFAIASQGQRNYLLRFLLKLNTDYEETSFRTPNLDEISLKVSQS